MTKENKIPKYLVFLILISFGFFGSLSHLFSLLLIIFFYGYFWAFVPIKKIDRNSVVLYLFLTGIFFVFLVSGSMLHNFRVTLISLGPMLPIPIIGLLLISPKNYSFLADERIF